jgi:hypothetical protein
LPHGREQLFDRSQSKPNIDLCSFCQLPSSLPFQVPEACLLSLPLVDAPALALPASVGDDGPDPFSHLFHAHDFRHVGCGDDV